MNAAKTYARTRNETASRERLMALLFEKALVHMRTGAADLEAGRVHEGKQAMTKAGDIVAELSATLDVAKDLNRRARGFDLAPFRADIEKADARKLPVESNAADVVFMDPPYGDHIHYSDEPRCIGKLSAYDPAFFQAMRGALEEAHRVLRPGGVLAVYVCDYFERKRGLAPVGFGLFSILTMWLEPIDIVAVVRHNKDLDKGNYRQAAERDNFFLRGFNYLLLARKPEAPAAPPPRAKRR